MLLQINYRKSFPVRWIWTFLTISAKETRGNQWIDTALNPLCQHKVPHFNSTFRWKKDKFYTRRCNKQTSRLSQHTFWIYLKRLSLPFKTAWAEVNLRTLIVHGSEYCNKYTLFASRKVRLLTNRGWWRKFLFFFQNLAKRFPKEPEWFRAVITARSSINWTIFERVNGS